jgi:CHAT domain-containing protein
MRSERIAALRSSGAHILQELGILRARLARAVIVDDSAQIERLRGRGEELERLLATYLPAGVEVPTADLIATSLPEETTLVTYVLIKVIDFAHVALGKPPIAREGLHTKQQHRYVAFVTTAHQLRMIDLGLADHIDANLSSMRDLLTPHGRPDQAHERDIYATALREQLIDPLELHDQNLLMVTGGRLGLLPFQLLPLKHNGRLIDTHTISYLSAPRDILRWTNAARYHAPGPPLVIADPDYDLGAQNARRLVVPLPGTAKEGRNVARLLGTEALTGAKATKISLTAAQSPIIVHLATHGIFLPSPQLPPPSDHYERVYVVKVPGEGDFLMGAENDTSDNLALPGLPTSEADPLLRSAVALAGLNTWLNGATPPSEADIGMLTADEACTLNLRDTQLVVLSACDTGLGDHRIGEGLIGLRWAFAVAGASAVVTTLWQVPDYETAQLMKELYAKLTTGMAISDALRAAQIAIRNDHSDPYYWSAFVVHGDPATAIFQYLPTPQ